MAKPYDFVNEVQSTLSVAFVHGTDASLTLTSVAGFPTGGGYIRVGDYDATHWVLYEYTGIATNDLTGLTACTLGVVESEAAYTFAIGTVVEVANAAEMVKDVRDEAVHNTDFDAQSIIAAVTDNTPVKLTVAEQTLVGRITGGNVGDLSAAQSSAIVHSVGLAAAWNVGGYNLTDLGAATAFKFNGADTVERDWKPRAGQATIADQFIYVSTSGNDTTGTGSSIAPLRTIQKAIDLLPEIIVHAVVIRVDTGTYEPAATLDFSGKTILGSLTISAYDIANSNDMYAMGTSPSNSDADNKCMIADADINANDEYNAGWICIWDGISEGDIREISDTVEAATDYVTVSSNFSVRPTNASKYALGGVIVDGSTNAVAQIMENMPIGKGPIFYGFYFKGFTGYANIQHTTLTYQYCAFDCDQYGIIATDAIIAIENTVARCETAAGSTVYISQGPSYIKLKNCYIRGEGGTDTALKAQRLGLILTDENVSIGGAQLEYRTTGGWIIDTNNS